MLGAALCCLPVSLPSLNSVLLSTRLLCPSSQRSTLHIPSSLSTQTLLQSCHPCWAQQERLGLAAATAGEESNEQVGELVAGTMTLNGCKQPAGCVRLGGGSRRQLFLEDCASWVQRQPRHSCSHLVLQLASPTVAGIDRAAQDPLSGLPGGLGHTPATAVTTKDVVEGRLHAWPLGHGLKFSMIRPAHTASAGQQSSTPVPPSPPCLLPLRSTRQRQSPCRRRCTRAWTAGWRQAPQQQQARLWRREEVVSKRQLRQRRRRTRPCSRRAKQRRQLSLPLRGHRSLRQRQLSSQQWRRCL